MAKVETLLQRRVRERVDMLPEGPVALATAVGLQRDFISDLIGGRKQDIKTADLPKLAEALRCEPGDLVSEGGWTPRTADAAQPAGPANHLRAWREHARLEQQELADAVGTTLIHVVALEEASEPPSASWLFRLAPALGTTPGFILEHDPETAAGSLLKVWSGIPEERQGHALDILRTFAA